MDITLQTRLDNIAWSVATVIFIAVGSILVGYLARQVARGFRLSEAEQRKVFWGFAFASPWLLGFVIFVVGPALASFYYSFTNYRLGEEMSWVGLDNYRDLLAGSGAHGRRFAQSIYNSFYYAAIGVPLQIATALGMAMILNQNLRGIRFFRLIFYVPVILAGGPAILLAWRYMLASNGGFINEMMKAGASGFPPLDWLNRLFIFSVESFNGFYTGIVRGDPLGPWKYVIPALIAVAILYGWRRGEWTETRRGVAWRVVELLGMIAAVILVARGIIADPIDPLLILAGGVAGLAGILMPVWNDNAGLVRGRQWLALGLIGTAWLIFALLDFVDGADKGVYHLLFVLALAPVAASFMGAWTPTKTRLFTGVWLALGGLLLAGLAQGQFDAGQLSLIPQYLFLQSNLADTQSLDYLRTTYSQESLSPLWMYGAVIAVMAGVALLDTRYPRARQTLIYAALVGFGLVLVSATIDGLRYFRAYEDIAQATSSPNYHFALFRNASAQFPDSTRVPLWMSSELWSKPSLILITMWSSGAGMLIFLAALKGIPQTFYEAADVDGANRWQKFYKITLPMISPAMFYNIVIGMIAALQTFEAVYILQTPQTQDSLASAAYFLFVRTFRQLAIGQGAAVSWILAVIIVLLTVLQFRYSKWVNYDTQ